ncbi:MAG: dodecin family protein [Phycisphaeraceae bacterium]
MAIAKTVEISAGSPDSFDDAVKQGIARAAKTIEGIREVWVKEQKAVIENNQVSEYRVHMKVTFLLKE